MFKLLLEALSVQNLGNVIVKVLIVALCFPILSLAEDMNEDSDGDGLPDREESQVHHTDSQLSDTDTDGLSDGLEVNQYWTLPLVADTDGDGFLDGVEVRLNSDPNDGGSKPDPENPLFNDLDGDGISNSEEKEFGSDPQRVDTDFDNLTDYEEIRKYFTNPVLVDTDGDGVWDGDEVQEGTDPGDATSVMVPHSQTGPREAKSNE